MFKNNIIKPNNPVNEDAFALFDMMHSLSIKKNCNFSINFIEEGKDWFVTLEQPNVKKVETEKKNSLVNALKEAVRTLKRWNF